MDAGRPHPPARRRDRGLRRRPWATRPTCSPPAAATSARTCTGATSGRWPRSTTTDTLLGFGYGYPSEPGQWWHDQVRGAIRRDAAGGLARPTASRWSSCTCCRPRRGTASGAAQLRDAARHGDARRPRCCPRRRRDEATSRAWRLYRRFGFVDVVRHFLFPGDAPAVRGARPHAAAGPVTCRCAGCGAGRARRWPRSPIR